VLDAGCGPGRDSRYFGERHGLRVIGVDASGGMVAEAARRVPPPARFARMDLRRLGFVDAAFEGVWCNAALLHVPRSNVAGALAELVRVLRPAGCLAVSVKEGAGEAIVGAQTGEPRFFTFFTTDEIAALMAAAGLRVDDVTLSAPSEPLARHRWIHLSGTKPPEKAP
jgi:SAM-dependent methyltransferase